MMHGILHLKNKIIFTLICVLFICFVAIAKWHKPNEILDVNQDVSEYLKTEGISDYQIAKIDDYKKIKCKKIKKAITDEDRQQYIENDLESHEVTKVVKDRNIVNKGDVVTVSYTIMNDDEVKEEVQEESFMVGKGFFNIQIEEGLIGKEKGEKIIIDISDNNDVKKTAIVVVKTIKTVTGYELNREYVEKFYGFTNLDEYYKMVDEILTIKNENEKFEEEKQEILKKVSKCFDITLNEEEVAKFSVGIVEEYKQIAYMNGMDINQYYQEVLELSEEEFMQKCYDEGEERIKEYIAIGVIANKEKITSHNEGNNSEENTYLVIKNTIEFFEKNS